MIKKCLLLWFLFIVGLSSFALGSSMSYALELTTQNEVNIVFDGSIQRLQKPVLFYRNTVMVPVKDTIEASGIKTDKGNFVWTSSESSLNIFDKNRLFKIFNGKRDAYIGETKVKLQYMPFIYNGSMYISYSDLSQYMDWVGIWEKSTKVMAFCHGEVYWRNKELLTKISQTLDIQPQLLVDISFDYGDENILFNFKIDNMNRLLNGSFQDTKTSENKLITEKSELFIKGDNLFIKDFKINKWRLDESANFEVASSFLKAFSSQYMLEFSDFACATFTYKDTPRGLIFQNNTPFNAYMRKDMGFAVSQFFNFKMFVNKNDNSIKNIVVMNTNNYGQDSKSGRMDVGFGAYGKDVNISIPESFEFADANVDDSRKINAIKKALTLFIFDADKDAFTAIEKCKNVEEIIVMLQKPIEVTINNDIITYGPYLANVLGNGEPDATYYRPEQADKKGLNITINKKSKSVDIQIAEKDKFLVK